MDVSESDDRPPKVVQQIDIVGSSNYMYFLHACNTSTTPHVHIHVHATRIYTRVHVAIRPGRGSTCNGGKMHMTLGSSLGGGGGGGVTAGMAKSMTIQAASYWPRQFVSMKS